MKTNRIKSISFATAIAGLLMATQACFSQGFVNLNFESANISGYSSGSTDVPIGLALPGWSAYNINSLGTASFSQVGYNFLSLGAPGLSLIDINADGLPTLQGNDSVVLFGSLGNTIALNQTGFVPNDTESLLLDVYADDNFEVTLGGHTLNFVPLQNFPNYTIYGADISTFAGNTETLSLIAPPTRTPNIVEFDSIIFSPSLVPEPDVLNLCAIGSAVLALCRWKARAI